MNTSRSTLSTPPSARASIAQQGTKAKGDEPIARPSTRSAMLPQFQVPNSNKPSVAILELNEKYRKFLGPAAASVSKGASVSTGGVPRIRRAQSMTAEHNDTTNSSRVASVMKECIGEIDRQRMELASAIQRASEAAEQCRESGNPSALAQHMNPGTAPAARRSSMVANATSPNTLPPHHQAHRVSSASSLSKEQPAEAALDACLHFAFRPTTADLPPFDRSLAVVKPSYAKAYTSEVEKTITTALATAQRTRRNALEHAMDAIRGKRELFHHLKESVAKTEELRHEEALKQYGDRNYERINASRAVTPALRRTDHRMFVEHHEQRLDKVWTLHDEIMERFQQEVEEMASGAVVRGASRSRDRVWATILSVLLSGFTIRAFVDYHKDKIKAEAERRTAEEEAREQEERHNRRMLRLKLLRGTVSKTLIDRLDPLVATLKQLSFGATVKEYFSVKRKAPVDRIRIALMNYRNLSRMKKSVAHLMRSVRRLQRALRDFLKSRVRRRDFMVAQFEHYLTERLTYDRKTCLETDRRTLLKNKAKAGAKPAPALKALSGAFSMEASTSASGAFGQFAAGSMSFAPSPLSGDMSQRRQSTTPLARSPSNRYGSFVTQRSRSIVITDELISKRLAFQQLLARMTPIALPHVPDLAHGNGRLGGNIPVARQVALETHPLIGTGAEARAHARIAPRIRDALLSFAAMRERLSFTQRMTEWRSATAEARIQYEWLQQIAELQQGRTHSPAQQELDSFIFPFRPIRRVLLSANDMRLIVLVAFAVAAQEKRLSAGSAADTSLAALPEIHSTSLSSSPTEAIDEGNVAFLIGHFHKILNLPGISSHLLERPDV